jgi:polar amino acid transport system ATP-binding protein
MAFAREVSNRVAFFKDGLIHEIGSPKQIFEAPERAENAAFLNSVL